MKSSFDNNIKKQTLEMLLNKLCKAIDNMTVDSPPLTAEPVEAAASHAIPVNSHGLASSRMNRAGISIGHQNQELGQMIQRLGEYIIDYVHSSAYTSGRRTGITLASEVTTTAHARPINSVPQQTTSASASSMSANNTVHEGNVSISNQILQSVYVNTINVIKRKYRDTIIIDDLNKCDVVVTFITSTELVNANANNANNNSN